MKFRMARRASIPVPEIFVEIDRIIRADFNAIFTQQLRLDIYPAERERGSESAETVHHAKTGDIIWLGIGVERVSYRPRPFLVPREVGYLPVCRDPAPRYLFDDLIDLLKRRHTNPLSVFYRPGYPIPKHSPIDPREDKSHFPLVVGVENSYEVGVTGVHIAQKTALVLGHRFVSLS